VAHLTCKRSRACCPAYEHTAEPVVCGACSGEIETYNAYRVQHDNSRGPYKGGLRYHPAVDLDDVRRRVSMERWVSACLTA